MRWNPSLNESLDCSFNQWLWVFQVVKNPSKAFTFLREGYIKCKRSLVNTMVNRIIFFSEECNCLRGVNHNLNYPKPLAETTIKRFVERRISSQEPCPSPGVPSEIVRVVLPRTDQYAANYAKQQLNNLRPRPHVAGYF